MHHIEPHYSWRHIYVAEEDEYSPFFGREHSEFHYSEKIYNFYIHPQWDGFGSPTVYAKHLMSDYAQSYAIIELIGEWNDSLHNDIMLFKDNVAARLMRNGICKFVLIGENLLNFHYSDDCYYEEWFEDVTDEGGWICFLNLREHIRLEMDEIGLRRFINYGSPFDAPDWRTLQPHHLVQLLEKRMMNQLLQHF